MPQPGAVGIYPSSPGVDRPSIEFTIPSCVGSQYVEDLLARRQRPVNPVEVILAERFDGNRDGQKTAVPTGLDRNIVGRDIVDVGTDDLQHVSLELRLVPAHDLDREAAWEIDQALPVTHAMVFRTTC